MCVCVCVCVCERERERELIRWRIIQTIEVGGRSRKPLRESIRKTVRTGTRRTGNV